MPYIFFFKIKNCLNDDLFISCDDRICSGPLALLLLRIVPNCKHHFLLINSYFENKKQNSSSLPCKFMFAFSDKWLETTSKVPVENKQTSFSSFFPFTMKSSVVKVFSLPFSSGGWWNKHRSHMVRPLAKGVQHNTTVNVKAFAHFYHQNHSHVVKALQALAFWKRLDWYCGIE